MSATPDFRVVNHGTVWNIRAVSTEAKVFARQNLEVEDWMGTPDNFTTDWRPAMAIAESLRLDGFEVV